MKNPFIGSKFILSTNKNYIKNLLSDNWFKVPPISCEIDPTNNCNQNCIWCMYKDFREANPISITKRNMKRIIRELGAMKCKSVTFTGGGEPLVNKEVMPEAFKYVTDNNMKCGLVTNGLLVDEYYHEILSNCTFIRFSIDASNYFTYSILHGANRRDFERITASIKNICINGLDVGMAFLVHPSNYTEVYDFCMLGYDLGVNYVEFRPVLVEGLKLNNKIVDSVLSQIAQAKSMEDNDFRIFTRLGRFEEQLGKDKGFIECLSTPLVMVIASDYNVYLCCQTRGDKNYILGNYGIDSLKTIWNSPERREIVNNINVSKCLPCRYKNYNVLLEQLKNCTHEEFL